MGLFFFRKEIEREQLAQRLDSLESQIELLNARIQDITILMANEIAKQIQAAKAVDKAHEKHPSLHARMVGKKIRRTRRVGTYAEKQYSEPYRIAVEMKSSGRTLTQICNVLNAKGFRSVNGCEWYPQILVGLLENEHQKDQLKYEQLKQSKQATIQTDAQRNFLNGIM